MNTHNALLWNPHLPEGWLKAFIGINNRKGLGFQLGEIRLWVANSPHFKDFEVQAQYKHRYTGAWRTLLRTTCWRNELAKTHLDAQFMLENLYQDMAVQKEST